MFLKCAFVACVKLTINLVSQLDTYTLPRVENLFATIAGGKTFAKQGMYQEMLDVTINTHKGHFNYNCLVFGVSSSPAIFQCTTDNLLQNIPDVSVYLENRSKVCIKPGPGVEEMMWDFIRNVFQASSATYLGHHSFILREHLY